MTHFRPRDERELAQIVSAAAAREEPCEVIAGGSKRRLGRPLQVPHTLDIAGFTGIIAYEPEELVLTAGAATPLAEIEAALARAGQMLAFEPPDWRALLGTTGAKHTLGGVIATNLSGPRRIKQGAARDHFLGFRAVSGRGEAFKAGGRVVKNVTGYDLSKLLAGSFGTLAVLTEITIKVLPRPETEATVLLSGLDDIAASAAMTQGLNSPHEVSGAAHLPKGATGRERAVTALRLEGPAPSVTARAAALRAELVGLGTSEEMRGEASQALWRAIGEAAPLAASAERVLWRISLPPGAGPALARALAAALDAHYVFDWGGGLVWLAVAGAQDGGAAAIRGEVAKYGGHATLIRASDSLRAAVPVFEPPAPALAALTTRVKQSFDPQRILNRGRMYPEL